MAAELIENLPDKNDPDFVYKERVIQGATASAYIGPPPFLSNILAEYSLQLLQVALKP